MAVHHLLLVLESVVGGFGLRLYEEPRYTVLDAVNEEIEIRRYAPRRAAEVALPRGDGKHGTTLFGFCSTIFLAPIAALAGEIQ